MAKKMLVDAGHPEETRVVVVSGNRIEEFDFESAARKQLKGNIYLAKVTRVEPSLQAAFVEYGGNRHGFLAFSEIHPDYYQIPMADRERLLKQEAEESRRLAEEANEAEEYEGARGRRGSRRGGKRGGRRKRSDNGKATRTQRIDVEFDPADILAFADMHLFAPSGTASPGATAPEMIAETGDDSVVEDDAGEVLLRSRSHWVLPEDEPGDEARPEESETANEMSPPAETDDGDAEQELKRPDADGDEEESDSSSVEGEDAETTTFNELTADEEAREELARRPRVRLRDYKIQEVIKRRQIMLVQVVKEERGNKGAALTTYLSLAGRYCVLMPNTPRGGGISRKITNAADRKRLKAIAGDMDVPEGMGLIIRTAGANRTKAEIRRDYEYLLRLWESVRELTLQSSAPCLVYEEGSLIKRSIRDLYSREIDTVQVEGEDGYKEAKAFMRMLMPSHAKNVQSYKDRIPLFQRYQVEQQLDAMLNPQVQLPSGGYIVLNPTEALVAIDVNSGKSTREHNIEDTALRTNLEAAEEVARQLRLRDLAGLIVIDFIDMEEPRNNRAVERKLKECLKQDRARIQTGRISMFGLLEMSRQRLRPGMMEVSTVICDDCQGTGIVRSVESAALRILRACEEEGLRQRTQDVSVPCAPDVATYLLNNKRHQLADIEKRYGVAIYIESDITAGRDSFEIKRGEPMSESRRQAINEQAVRLESAFGLEEAPAVGPAEPEEAEAEAEAATPAPAEDKPKQRRGGRRRRKGEEEEARTETAPAADSDTEMTSARGGAQRKAAPVEDGGEPRRRRRRGKRGGRRHRKTGVSADRSADQSASPETGSVEAHSADTGSDEVAHPIPTAPTTGAEKTEGGNGFGAHLISDVQAEAGSRNADTGSRNPPETAEIGSERATGNGHETHLSDREADDREAAHEAEADEKAETGTAQGESPAGAEAAKRKEPARRGWWQRRPF